MFKDVCVEAGGGGGCVGGAENVEPGWAKCFTYVVLLNQ